MAGLMPQPQRFTNAEWTFNNNVKYRMAEKEREEAQYVQDDCDRLMDETAKRTERTLNDVNKKIGQRINDVKYWKSEVNKKLTDLSEETDLMNTSLIRLRKALEATEEPLHIAQQCIVTREERTGGDLVHDDAQKELYKEAEVIKGVQALLQRTIEQAKEQLRLNRKAIFNLKRNAEDKLAAQKIDEYALSLKETDESLPGKQGAAQIDFRSITSEEWQAYTNQFINDGDKQLQLSQQLRSIIDGILQQVASDQLRQIEATNLALQKRISETRSAKGKLEEHLAEVLAEISKIEDTITDVKKAIKDKEGALRLAGTRLDLRDGRPNNELCRDPANYRLIQEIDEITKDVAQLKQRLEHAQKSLKALCRRQLDLEEEIQIKASTLFIDEVQCKGIRESLRIHSY